MAALLIALIPVLLAIGGAGGYLVRRVLERGRDRDAVAIERARIDYLKELKALAESLSKDATTKTMPLIAAAMETSLVSLTEGQSRSGVSSKDDIRSLQAPSPSRLVVERADLDSLAERSAAPYRIELVKIAKDLVDMSFVAARDAYEVRDLIGFRAAWSALARGAGAWTMAGQEAECRAKTEPLADKLRKWFQQMDTELGEAFANKTVYPGAENDRPSGATTPPALPPETAV